MKELIHICQWGRKRETAWSGTYLKIFDELQKHYDVYDLGLKQDFWDKFWAFMRKRVSFAKYDFSYRNIKKNARKIVNKVGNREVCTFQYSELPLKEKVHSYIYLDMCMDYIDSVFYNDPELWQYYSFNNISQNALKKRVKAQNDFFKSCAGIFTMGQWLEDYLVDSVGIPRERVHTVGAGVDIKVELLTPEKKENNKVLFIGRGFKTKGGDLLVEAFDILRREYLTDAELYIIGPRENPLNYNHPGIKYLGPLGMEEVMHYYSICDIFCMPSHFDAYGKVFLESLCCGLPCIARNAFAMGEIIKDGENGYLIDNDDPLILANKMLKLLQNQQIKENVINNKDKYFAEYSWCAVANRIEKVIDQDEYMRV